jgi:hypothetical protein
MTCDSHTKSDGLVIFMLVTCLWAHSGLSWWPYLCIILVGIILNLVLRDQ